MTYMEAVNKAIETVVSTDDKSGITYLEPLYRWTLRNEGLVMDTENEETKDLPTEFEMSEILHLYVEKQNAINNKTNAVIEWLYDVITQTVDPAITAEDNELMKNMIEYMQLNESLKEKESRLNEQEKAVDGKERFGSKVPKGLSFAKRKIRE